MAKIVRKVQKIFGMNAGLNEISQYGSLAAGSIAYTTDPATIQALANYLEGWFSGVVGSNSPAIEDMNALCYLFAYQLSYIMQAGVPEYDADTTYYIGSLVTDGTGTIYCSLTDDNLGESLTDSTNWFTPPSNGLLTPNAMPWAGTTTLPVDQTLTWANAEIGNGQTVVVPSDANFIALTAVTVTGTGVLTATGTGVIRVI